MKDSDKDWLACAWACWRHMQMLNDKMNALSDDEDDDDEFLRLRVDRDQWRTRMEAALFHQCGEGWSLIRERLKMSSATELWLQRWTT